MSTRAEQALEKHLLKMKAMGVTVTSTPAAGRESDFGERPFGIIQAAADRLGMGNPTDDTLAAAGDDLRDRIDDRSANLIVHPRDVATYRELFPYANVIPSEPVTETALRDLIVTDPPAADWRPAPEELC